MNPPESSIRVRLFWNSCFASAGFLAAASSWFFAYVGIFDSLDEAFVESLLFFVLPRSIAEASREAIRVLPMVCGFLFGLVVARFAARRLGGGFRRFLVSFVLGFAWLPVMWQSDGNGFAGVGGFPLQWYTYTDIGPPFMTPVWHWFLFDLAIGVIFAAVIPLVGAIAKNLAARGPAA